LDFGSNWAEISRWADLLPRGARSGEHGGRRVVLEVIAEFGEDIVRYCYAAPVGEQSSSVATMRRTQVRVLRWTRSSGGVPEPGVCRSG